MDRQQLKFNNQQTETGKTIIQYVIYIYATNSTGGVMSETTAI